MRIFPAFDLGQQGRCPPMLGVTIAAFRNRVDRKHSSMWRHQVQHLGRDILMTNQTAILHGLVFPGSNMTCTAGAGDFCMGVNSSQQVTSHGIERARAEHLSPTRDSIPRDGKNRDQRGDDTSTCQTTQPASSHLSSSLGLFQEGGVI